jgi:DNA-binding transcriptional MerR regulator
MWGCVVETSVWIGVRGPPENTDCDTIAVTIVKGRGVASLTRAFRRPGFPGTVSRQSATKEAGMNHGSVTDSVDELRGLLTLDELTNRVGMSVRNVRFYTTKGLVPPPLRRGRSGYYTPDHVARLELVQELQSHGFTLAAIEGYLAGIPADASPEDIALRRTMLAPWQAGRPVVLSLADLERRCDRALSSDDLQVLAALGIAEPVGEETYEVAQSQLSVGLALLDLGYPLEAAVATGEIYRRHGRELAHELYDVFRRMVWPVYRESGASPETVQAVVERLKPLSVASLVSAYEAGMDETKRENIARKARG